MERPGRRAPQRRGGARPAAPHRRQETRRPAPPHRPRRTQTQREIDALRRDAERARHASRPPKVELAPKEHIPWFVFGQKLSFDYGVLVCTILLTMAGLLMVLSSSTYAAGISGDSLSEFRQQVFGAVVGFAGLFVLMNLDYRILRQRWIIYTGVAGTVLLLALVVLLPHIVSGPPIWSPRVNEAHRWLRFGTKSHYLSIQPSEIAKITLVLFLSAFLTTRSKHMGSIVYTLMPALFVAGLYFGFIILQPNLSTSGALLLVTLIMLYVAGAKWQHLSLLILMGIGLVIILVLTIPNRLVRYTSFLDPWSVKQGSGWQLIQSYFALGNGGWFGTGIGMSRQKHLFLPYASSDFIFAIVGEELGFVGATVILLLFLTLIYFGIQVAIKAYDKFGCYLAAGTTAMLAVQVVINIAVVTGSMPTTGLPLPFFTAGGTTLSIFLCSMGLLLSVSRRQNPLAKKS